MNVFIEPIIILLKVVSKLPIILKLDHPQLQAEIYLPEGAYNINTPYTDAPVEKWVHA